MGILMRLRSDSLMVFDAGSRRVSTFNSQGAFIRSVPIVAAGRPLGPPIGALLDGSVLVPVTGAPLQPGELRRPDFQYSRFVPESGALHNLFVVQGPERVQVTVDGAVVDRARPFGRTPIVAVGHDRVYAGDGTTYEIRAYTPSGKLERIIRRDGPLNRVDRAAIATYRSSSLGDRATEAARQREERIIDALVFPETMPAYGRFIVDEAQRLWVQQYRIPADTTPVQWTVFDADGRVLGVGSTPPNLTILEIGKDYMIGRRLDRDDVEHIVVMAWRMK
jgi:hypothetical protein